MNRIIKAAAVIAALLPGLAAAQGLPQFPQNLPGATVVGRLGTQTGPSQAIPFSVLASQLQLAGKAVIGPASATVGNFALWSNILGTGLSDGGTPGTLAFVNGGTGVNTALAASLNATGGLVGFSGALGTPVSGTLTNATGLPISTGVSGLGTGCATFLGTPSSANLRGCLTDEVGTGAAYFVGGALGTPASGTATNLTGLPVSTGLTGSGTGVLTALGIAVNASGGIVSPTPTRAGDIAYWNGSSWVSLAGNNSGTQVLQENVSGVPSWATVSGTGTVTSVACGTGLTGGTITTTGTCAVSLTTASNILGANVLLNSTGSYFDGPSMAQGTSGTWFASGTVTVAGGSAGDDLRCKLWDGTTVISSAVSVIPVVSYKVVIALSGILASPAANIKISCQDPNNTTATMLFNSSGNSKDSTISGFRIQ